jgi:outer membrane biosynthesis protein TonB
MEKKPEEPKKEETAKEEPKMEEPKKEEPPKEEPKKEEPKKEEPPKEESKKEEPKKEEPPKMEEPKKEEPPKEEPRKEPPPKSVDVVLAEADKLLVDGSAIFREMVQASKQLPDDQGQLQALLKRQEEGMALFTRAREAYLSVKDKASPESKVEERLGKIEKILGLLQKYGDGIKSKLK